MTRPLPYRPAAHPGVAGIGSSGPRPQKGEAMHGRIAAGALTVAVALGVPAAGHAATKTVSAGPFAKQKQFQDAFGDANEYFRQTVTIHRGDRVRWRINGFHSVTFVPPGEEPPGLLLPQADNLVAGVNDAAGVPFWFNGQPN